MARDTGSLNRARNRRILVQGSMRSDTVVIFGTRFEYPAQMRLAQDNDVVHPLTPDRSDQPFGKAILPGRSWCGKLVPDAHGAQSAGDNAAIDPVTIADQVVRSLIPRKGLRDLTRNPFCRRICRGVDPDEFSAVQPDDDEGIEQVETDSRDNEQIHRGNIRRVIAQEGSLGGESDPPTAESQMHAPGIPNPCAPRPKSRRSARPSRAPCRDWPSPRSDNGRAAGCTSPTPSCPWGRCPWL